MKFNLFLLLLFTLLAVASSKVFQIVEPVSNTYWSLQKSSAGYIIALQAQSSSGIWWINVPYGSAHEIVVRNGQPFAGQAVTYNGPGIPLSVTPTSNPPKPNQLWKFDPVSGKLIAIQASEPAEFANKNSNNVVIAGLGKNPQWVLKDPPAKKIQSDS